MIMKKIVFLVALSILIFSSCSSFFITPKIYQEEIEDSVKFNIATCMVLADVYSDYERNSELLPGLSFLFEKDWIKFCDSVDSFEEYVFQLMIQTEYENACYIILNQTSEDYSNKWCRIATMLLEKYNNIDIIISDYYEIETSTDARIWQFTELNTGLEGRFIYEDYSWTCGLTESSMEELFFELSYSDF